MKANISGAVAKLGRAYFQLEALNNEVTERFVDESVLRVEQSPDRLKYRFYLGDQVPTVPPHWALVASEILFNIRSALDYLVYELHVRRFRGNLPTGTEELPQFPFRKKAPKNGFHTVQAVKPLSRRDQKALEQFQFFKDRNDSLKYVRATLNELNDMQNADKHRQLRVIAVLPRYVFHPTFPAEVGFRLNLTQDPSASNAYVMQWTFERLPDKFELTTSVRLGAAITHDGQPRALTGSLGAFVDAATVVLERFADRFEKVERPTYWRYPIIGDPPRPVGARPLRERTLFIQ